MRSQLLLPTPPYVRTEKITSIPKVFSLLTMNTDHTDEYLTGAEMNAISDGRQSRSKWVRVQRQGSPGNVAIRPNPNVLVIERPVYHDDSLVVHHLGCDHHLVTVRTRNCYRELACDKGCNFSYAIDSSD